MVSIGRWVADRPTRCTGPSARWVSRSSVMDRCEPRLLPATAWISSTITVCTPRSISRLRSEVTSRYSDSGVVTRKSGGLRSMAARSDAAVSPVLTATRISGTASPSPAATSPISRSGASRFCWMSTASAFSGETYTTRGPRGASASPASAAGRPAWHSRSMQTRKAARVFPEPVGAAIRVSFPAAISRQPPSCGAVGPSGNRRSNQARTAG